MAGLNSRWKKGNIRYTRDVKLYIARFRELPGWYRAAKITKQRKRIDHSEALLAGRFS